MSRLSVSILSDRVYIWFKRWQIYVWYFVVLLDVASWKISQEVAKEAEEGQVRHISSTLTIW